MVVQKGIYIKRYQEFYLKLGILLMFKAFSYIQYGCLKGDLYKRISGIPFKIRDLIDFQSFFIFSIVFL